jgi:hypothetical protein
VFDRELPQDVEDHLVLDHVLPLWLARHGHVVLHGATLVKAARSLVLTGHSGVGKSTLTSFLGGRGWLVGGDDAAIVHKGSQVTVEATYPTVRLPSTATSLLGLSADAGVPVAGKRRIDPPLDRIATEPAELALVARINPVEEDEARFEPVHGASALDLLLTNTFHVDLGSTAHLAGLMDGLIRLIDSAVVGELYVPRGPAALVATQHVLEDVLAL